jgi:hypothetical protein
MQRVSYANRADITAMKPIQHWGNNTSTSTPVVVAVLML